MGPFCFANRMNMKQILLRIDDAAYEKFMGMVSLCPMVDVLNVCEVSTPQHASDAFVAMAIREMQRQEAFRSPGDYAFLMVAFNDGVVKGLPYFYTPKDFIDYLKACHVDSLPGRSTVYNTMAKVRGKYPDWLFTDDPKATESLRRRNIIKQFLSAFVRAQSGKLDDLLDDFQ